MGDHPRVTVIMTALNEARHLTEAVDSVFAQDYPGRLDLVVAVGPSRDGTWDLASDLAAEHGRRMRVVENPTGRTPAGLNIAIADVDPGTEVVVRTDGHAELPRSYVRTAVTVMQQTGAANVGGMMIPEGTTPFESAVARAMSRRIGLGSVSFHTGGQSGPADTVYLGVFARSVLERTGGFDEAFTRAQDWELNHRINTLDEIVWFDPRLQVRYRPRPNLARLAVQFHGSGKWRWQIIRTYPETVSVRYLAAPVTALAIGAAATAALANATLVHSPAIALLAASVPTGYLAVIVGGALLTRRGLDAAASVWYPAVLVTMHLSWGSGFLAGVAADVRQTVRSRVRGMRSVTSPAAGGR